jgi:ATP-dependent 26S proteasome regulatory subunit
MIEMEHTKEHELDPALIRTGRFGRKNKTLI